jgi:hypothetical protein
MERFESLAGDGYRGRDTAKTPIGRSGGVHVMLLIL